jgi:hypothetical protein
MAACAELRRTQLNVVEPEMPLAVLLLKFGIMNVSNILKYIINMHDYITT